MSVDFLPKNFPPFQVHHAKKPPRFYPDGFQRNVIDFYLFFRIVGSEKPYICSFPILYGPYLPLVEPGVFFSLKATKKPAFPSPGSWLFGMHRIILAIHVFLLVQNFSPVAGRIHGDKGRVGRLKPLEKDTGAQPRVLGLQKQCKREGIPLGLDGFHPFDERDEVHLGKATFGLFAPLLDDKMIPADKFLEGLSCRLG